MVALHPALPDPTAPTAPRSNGNGTVCRTVSLVKRSRRGGRVYMKLLALGLMAILLAAPLANDGPEPPTEPTAQEAVTPGSGAAFADRPDAFHGLGQVAFLRGGQVHILDGDTDTISRVNGSEGASMLAWSEDGQWLAFLREVEGQQELMLAEAATSEAKQVVDLPGSVTGFQWSPAENLLAVSLAGEQRGESDNDAPGGAVWLVRDPSRPSTQPLLDLESPVGSLAWSPNGRSLAYVTRLPAASAVLPSDAVEVVSLDGGTPTRWFTADQAGIRLAGWWPDGKGLLLWVLPLHSASLAADGLPLLSLQGRATEPVTLPPTLLYRHWLSWDPSGQNLVMTRGTGRSIWADKSLSLCAVATGQCRDLAQPGGRVSLDPAWSPDGRQIAMVRAEARPGSDGFTSEEELTTWVNSRTLWLTNPEGSAFRELEAAGTGIYGPAWSNDGSHLLYVRKSALWVLDVQANQARRVVALENPEGLFGFYGFIDWWNRMAWYNGA